MWTRFFPAVEHARLLLERGVIGDVRLVQADFPDKCYAAQSAPLGFGSDAPPTAVVATSAVGCAGAGASTGATSEDAKEGISPEHPSAKIRQRTTRRAVPVLSFNINHPHPQQQVTRVSYQKSRLFLSRILERCGLRDTGS